jgi:hypothetical protein
MSFLREHGYVVDTSEDAARCSVYLDDVAAPDGEVALVELIESSAAPLLKLGRWPDGARSALCIAGDLDALSLGDYASRFLRLTAGESTRRRRTSTPDSATDRPNRG